jgi:hypothetical protein
LNFQNNNNNNNNDNFYDNIKDVDDIDAENVKSNSNTIIKTYKFNNVKKKRSKSIFSLMRSSSATPTLNHLSSSLLNNNENDSVLIHSSFSPDSKSSTQVNLNRRPTTSVKFLHSSKPLTNGHSRITSAPLHSSVDKRKERNLSCLSISSSSSYSFLTSPPNLSFNNDNCFFFNRVYSLSSSVNFNSPLPSKFLLYFVLLKIRNSLKRKVAVLFMLVFGFSRLASFSDGFSEFKAKVFFCYNYL